MMERRKGEDTMKELQLGLREFCDWQGIRVWHSSSSFMSAPVSPLLFGPLFPHL